MNAPIEVGVKSEYARIVQRVLRETVEPNLVVDGIVGKATMTAVAEFSKLMGLDASLGYSDDVRKHVDMYAAARFASEKSYIAAANALNVPYHHLRAVCEVESRGSAFLPDGRCVILFERHQFRKRLLRAVRDSNVFQVVKLSTGYTGNDVQGLIDFISEKHPDICNASRGGYLGGASEYKRLDKAVAIHMQTAHASASYGLFQIMGFNHKAAGYESPTAMALDYARSEEKQIHSLVSFISSDSAMHRALREGDWTAFAYRYNGSAYAENNYHTRLAAAANRYRKLV